MYSSKLMSFPMKIGGSPATIIGAFGEATKQLVTSWSSKFDHLPGFGPVNHVIVGTNGPDTLSTTAEGDVVLDLGGDDKLGSTFNRTALFGGKGNDILTTNLSLPVAAGETAKGLEFQFGGDGNDTLTTQVSVDSSLPFGSPGDRTATVSIFEDGGKGDDVITAVARADHPTTANLDLRTQIDGGSGNDRIIATADATGALGDNVVANVVNGGAGDDWITATAQTFLEGSTGTATNEVTGGDGNDFIEAAASAISLHDKLISNVLDGGRGNDVLHAFNQWSSLGVVGASVMDMRGGEGDDVLQGVVQSSLDSTTMTVDSHLDGGPGKDTLSLDSSIQAGFAQVHNLLEGGQGDDVLGSQLDLFVMGGGFNPQQRPLFDVSNVLKGGTGNDVLNASLSINAEAESDSHAENFLFGGSGDDQLTAFAEFTNIAPIPGASPAIANHLDGGAGNDRLTATIALGTDGASFLDGGAGNDILTVFGGNGNVLKGGAGKDVLIGGVGDDFMDGGTGKDVLVFAPPNGHDTAVFKSGQDLIDLTAFAVDNIHSFADLDITVIDENSVIRFDPNDDITVLKNTHLTASDFIFA